MMHLKRFACILLTLLLMLADSGQVIYAHTCTRSNRTSLSLTPGMACCHSRHGSINYASFKKSSCCETTSKYFKQTIPGQLQSHKEALPVAKSFVVTELFEAFAQPVAVHRPLITYPASLYERSDPMFTQVFRC
jgi:hypothetical protein